MSESGDLRDITTLNTKLRNLLHQHRSWSFGSFEVINAGIPGYTTYQELEFLKIYGLYMEPDSSYSALFSTTVTTSIFTSIQKKRYLAEGQWRWRHSPFGI